MMDLQTMPLRFRVWDTIDRKFIHPSDFSLDGDGELEVEITVNMYARMPIDNRSNRFVISQDTGLKDKEGDGIYTGSLVEWEGRRWEVMYDQSRGRLMMYCHETQEHEPVTDKKEPYWRVVGHIWQDMEGVC